MNLTAEATRFRDLKLRLILLVGCHLALAAVAAVAVIVAGEPYAAAKYALIEVLIALSGVKILAGVLQRAPWTRIPLQVFCLISLLEWPLSFFALGILWLLWTSAPPRLLSPEFQRKVHGASGVRATISDWQYLLGSTFLYLVAWAFVRAPPWSGGM